ncbi:hypothetical protein GGX14DRAFT_662399 [Mycena pura]|uniref:Uncharacterized protein n=1 Tax=Mycena pura TaxID=153505 RepID=A0AAD6V2V9_9AGAR|nr:hypothetical protein GGX14DRAFT_662399 [Mycena pura]
MTDGLPLPLHQFSEEDVRSLDEIVLQYVEGNTERNDTIAALTAGIVAICSLRTIPFTSDHILPYLEQLDAHDAQQGVGLGGGGSGNTGDGSQDGSQHSGDGDGVNDGFSPNRKRSLLDRMAIGDNDDDDGVYRAKRSRVDTSAFVWCARTNDFLNSMALTQEHRSIARQVEIYSLDTRETIRDISNSFHAPALPDSQWKNVILDRFVDFDTILTNSYAVEAEEPQQLILGDAHLEIKKSKVVSKISTHGQWINAYRSYEDAVNFAFEGRRTELRTYWNHINDLFSSRNTSLHGRILNYDRAARLFVGQRRDVLLRCAPPGRGHRRCVFKR